MKLTVNDINIEVKQDSIVILCPTKEVYDKIEVVKIWETLSKKIECVYVPEARSGWETKFKEATEEDYAKEFPKKGHSQTNCVDCD